MDKALQEHCWQPQQLQVAVTVAPLHVLAETTAQQPRTARTDCNDSHRSDPINARKAAAAIVAACLHCQLSLHTALKPPLLCCHCLCAGL